MSKRSEQGHISSHQFHLIDTPGPIAAGSSSMRVKLILIAWIAAISFDFIWHGGILADVYTHSNPALLDPEQAFHRIPYGYGALLVQVVLIYLVLSSLKVNEWRKGIQMGLIFGGAMGIASILGQFSILSLDLKILILWGLGQVVEYGAMGAVIGAGIKSVSLKKLAARVVVLVVIAFFFTIALQSEFH
ncbi:MAG: hypothetical protein ACFFCX_02210 [Candidatus Sifarchaeia archaeon]